MNWYTGRIDCQSFDAHTGLPFASVYCGEETVCVVYGEDCKERAQLIATAPRLLAACEKLASMPIADYASKMLTPQREAFSEIFNAAKAAKTLRQPIECERCQDHGCENCMGASWHGQ